MNKIFLGVILSFFLSVSAWAMSGTYMQLIVGSPVAGCGGTSTFVGNPGDTETFEYQANARATNYLDDIRFKSSGGGF